ncbi:MAG: hypothetical protein V4805_05865 [Pseudomonadota bacterium]
MDTPTTSQVRMKTVFHADLRDAHPGEDYWLQACGHRYPLVPHTEQSRAAAKAYSSALAALPDAQITHYTQTPADLPADRVVRVHIKHTLKTQPNAKGNAGLGTVAIHIPSPKALAGAHATAETAHQLAIDYVSTAKALVFHHPDLINACPATSAVIWEHVEQNQAIADQFNTLAMTMREMGAPGEDSGWAKLIPFTPDASKIKGCDGKTTYYQSQPAPEIMQASGAVTTALMLATKNDMRLAGKKWTLQAGTSVQHVSDEELKLRAAADIQAGAGGDAWNAALGSTGSAYGLNSTIKVLDASKRQVQLTMNNTYIRYLGGYIRFFDANDNALSVPKWKIDGEDSFTDPFFDAIQYDDLRYLGSIQPINTLLAIPIASDPGVLEVGITFPDKAVRAQIYASGLGTGADDWPVTPIMGGIMTGFLNLGIPAFMLGFGTATQASKPLYNLVKTVTADKAFLALIGTLGALYFGNKARKSIVNNKMDWHALTSLMKMLFSPAATKILLFVEAETMAEEAVDEIPFAGWLVLAMDISVGVAEMAETIIEVAMSPWNIENSISTSVTSTVNVHPDPRHKIFPAEPGQSARLTVKMIYQNQSRPTVVVTNPIPDGSKAIVLNAVFPNNTLGGTVKLEADYYVGDRLAAKATSGVMNNDEAHVANIVMTLVELPKKLSADSVYQHARLLTYQKNAYSWQDTTTAPTATIAATDTSSTGNAISVWSGLALSQRYNMIGLAWKAAGMGITSCASGQGGQLFALQGLGIPGTTSAVEFGNCGLDGQTLLTYDPYPPKFLMGPDKQWVTDAAGNPVADPADKALGEYYVDPRKAGDDMAKDGGFHLRKVVLSPATPFNMDSEQRSYGRFQFQPDSIALHPAGYAIAVNSQYGKLQIGVLVPEGANDADVPVARVFAGKAQAPDRPGLLFNPVAVGCSYDGTVLVLEDTKSSNAKSDLVLARVQAFDTNGNPVNRFFDSANKPSAFLNLSTTGDNTYLDIAVVGDHVMTYIYVLYYSGDGDKAADYHMAIYQFGQTAPVSNPLVVTDQLAANRIAVDMWHTLYSLNYAMVTDGEGHPAGPTSPSTAPLGRTVPSVSQWMPK